MSGAPASTLAERIEEVEGLDRACCLDRWRDAFGRPPPKHLSLAFLRRVLIWDLQCQALGGVSAKTERALARIASGKATPSVAAPGAQLIREWNGRTYQVEVVEDGYRMDGTTYRSLSAVARRITGAQWSGPRFFGLR